MRETDSQEKNGRNNKIKSWAEDDRPREKLLSKSPEALSNVELLAILLGTGTRALSAVDLARELFSSANHNLSELSRLSIKDMIKCKGIGEAKAITIIAALELGRRRRIKEVLDKKKIVSSHDAFEVFHPLLSDNTYEEFWIVTLNQSNIIRHTYKVSEGSLAGTVADPKKIFKLALDDHASSVILCHNHPSGNVTPSKKDHEITQKCKSAGQFLDLPVLDHIIVARDNYYSFADEGVL
jgi:DNA repair protein RadC